MQIYIHNSEENVEFKDLISLYSNLTFFDEFSEIEKSFMCKTNNQNHICCVEDSIIIKNISKYTQIWIINKNVLQILFNDYKHFYKKKLLHDLLKDVILRFTGFIKDERLLLLGSKAIIMGARISENLRGITHLIPYRFSGSTVTQISQRSNNIKIYNMTMIEYYWSNCLTIFSPYSDLNNYRLEEIFQARLFMNCRIILIGFDANIYSSMVTMIVRNGGSILSLMNSSKASHIICPTECDFVDAYCSELNSIPDCLHRNIVHYEWYKISMDCGYLASLENYQIFSGSYLTLPKCHGSNDVALGQAEITEEYNNDTSLDLCVTIPLIGYDPRSLTAKKIKDMKELRSNEIRELFLFFKDKYEFFNNFNGFLSTLSTEHGQLKMICEHFKHIEDFYRAIHVIFEPLMNPINEDMIFGMAVTSTYAKVKTFHKKFISDFENVKSTFKQAMKDSGVIREKFDQYLYKINFTLEGFINRPVLLLSKIQLLLKTILSHSAYTHPDITYIQRMVEETAEVIKFFDDLDSKIIEFKRQSLISNCTDKPICSVTSPFVCAVDCFLFDADALRTPMTMFLFTDKIMLCKFIDPNNQHKKFAHISSYLRNLNDGSTAHQDESDEPMSRSSSSLSLFMSPISSLRSKESCRRKESIKSASSDNQKSLFNQMEAVKFSKLFTGLSKLKLCAASTVKMYSGGTVYDKSRIHSIVSNVGGDDIESQLFLTLDLEATETERAQQLSLLLIPRLVKHFSDYGKIDSLFENDFIWDAHDVPNMSWGKFIVEEKIKFAELVARLFDISIIDRELNSLENFYHSSSDLSMSSYDNFSFATPNANFRTPNHRKDRTNTVVKNMTQSVKSTFRKIRNSFLPSPKSTKKMCEVARSSRAMDLLTEITPEVTADSETSVGRLRRVTMLMNNDEKENKHPEAFFRTPLKKSSPPNTRAAKRKSRDINNCENKNARF